MATMKDRFRRQTRSHGQPHNKCVNIKSSTFSSFIATPRIQRKSKIDDGCHETRIVAPLVSVTKLTIPVYCTVKDSPR